MLADQLSHRNPALEGADRVLLVESEAKLRSGRFHRQKLHLVLTRDAPLRRRAAASAGVEVDYRRAASLAAGLRAHAAQRHPDEVVLLEPTALGAGAALGRLPKVRVLDGGAVPDHGRRTSPAGPQGRTRLVMEDFYRWQRRAARHPHGRRRARRRRVELRRRQPPPAAARPAPAEALPPARGRDRRGGRAATSTRSPATPSATTGRASSPRRRDQALRALDRFVEHRLAALRAVAGRDGRPASAACGTAALSSSLNLGLLDPLECARAAEQAYRDGRGADRVAPRASSAS